MTGLADIATDPRWSLVSAEPYPLLIGGKLVPAADGAVFPAISPRDDQPIAKIAQAGAADVAAAAPPRARRSTRARGAARRPATGPRRSCASPT